ncbi:MAG TPA: RtcB family protein, partial [Thermotogota bacterium]|nr:RtcB family protein [Thermotogota bacterium]
TGSRHFGLTVAQLYQAKAASKMQQNGEARRSRAKGTPKDLAYLTGSDRNNYLHDIRLIQTYAKRNRERIAERILQKMGLKELASFESVHNYIDEKNILRKGAIAAHVGQPVIIPLNMRDGCILGTGKGNPEWNWSAPHGAGRLMSRREAKRILSIDEFRDQMKGVFSTCVDRTTIDESPMVYKAMEEILPVLGQTVDVRRIIRPIYNFKAAE